MFDHNKKDEAKMLSNIFLCQKIVSKELLLFTRHSQGQSGKSTLTEVTQLNNLLKGLVV